MHLTKKELFIEPLRTGLGIRSLHGASLDKETEKEDRVFHMIRNNCTTCKGGKLPLKNAIFGTLQKKTDHGSLISDH